MIAASILLGRALAPIEQSIGGWPLVQKSLAGWKNLEEILANISDADPEVSLPKPEARFAV